MLVWVLKASVPLPLLLLVAATEAAPAPGCFAAGREGPALVLMARLASASSTSLDGVEDTHFTPAGFLALALALMSSSLSESDQLFSFFFRPLLPAFSFSLASSAAAAALTWTTRGMVTAVGGCRRLGVLH